MKFGKSEDEEIWKKALTKAMVETGRDNCIETKLSRINIDYVSQLEVEDFYDFYTIVISFGNIRQKID